MTQALHRAIVQVDMSNLQPVLETVGVNGIAVVLSRNVDSAGGEVTDGVVSPAVAELQLEGLSAEGTSNKLVAQADAHNRFFTNKILNCIHYVVQ